MRVFILLLFILLQATKTDLEEKNLQLQRTNKALKQALRTLNSEAEVAEEQAVGCSKDSDCSQDLSGGHYSCLWSKCIWFDDYEEAEVAGETQVGATYSSHYNTLKCGDIGKLDVSSGSECASAYTAVTGQSASSTNYGGVQYISGDWAPYGCHMAYTGKSTPWLYWNSQYGDGRGYSSYQTICKTEDPDYGCGPGNAAPSGCDNKCGSTKVNDECGVCGGSGILDGKCDCSGNVVDECGVCGGEGYTDMCTWCDCQKWDEPNYSDCHRVASQAEARRYAVRCEQDGSTPMPGFWTQHSEECKKYSCNL